MNVLIGSEQQHQRRHSMQMLAGPHVVNFAVFTISRCSQAQGSSCALTKALARVMAPLFLTVAQLQHTFCPLSTRGHLAHLQGSQARSVPCTRLSRAVSRQQTVVRAVSEAEVMSNGTTNGDGAGIEHDRLAGTRLSTKTVHGGERAGRPRVSGMQMRGGRFVAIWQLHPAAAAAAAAASLRFQGRAGGLFLLPASPIKQFTICVQCCWQKATAAANGAGLLHPAFMRDRYLATIATLLQTR